MAWESSKQAMEITKVSGKTELRKAKERWSTKMVINTKVNGRIMNSVAMVSTENVTIPHIKVNSRTVTTTDKVLWSMTTAINTKVNGKMARKAGKECILGLTETIMMASGSETVLMAAEHP